MMSKIRSHLAIAFYFLANSIQSGNHHRKQFYSSKRDSESDEPVSLSRLSIVLAVSCTPVTCCIVNNDEPEVGKVAPTIALFLCSGAFLDRPLLFSAAFGNNLPILVSIVEWWHNSSVNDKWPYDLSILPLLDQLHVFSKLVHCTQTRIHGIAVVEMCRIKLEHNSWPRIVISHILHTVGCSVAMRWNSNYLFICGQIYYYAFLIERYLHVKFRYNPFWCVQDQENKRFVHITMQIPFILRHLPYPSTKRKTNSK